MFFSFLAFCLPSSFSLSNCHIFILLFILFLKKQFDILRVLIFKKSFCLWSDKFIFICFNQVTSFSYENVVWEDSSGAVYYMQPSNWYYFIVFFSEYLTRLFSFHYSIRYCWVKRLNIAINSIQKWNMSKNIKHPKQYRFNNILLKPWIFSPCIIQADWNIVLYFFKNQSTDSC